MTTKWETIDLDDLDNALDNIEITLDKGAKKPNDGDDQSERRKASGDARRNVEEDDDLEESDVEIDAEDEQETESDEAEQTEVKDDAEDERKSKSKKRIFELDARQKELARKNAELEARLAEAEKERAKSRAIAAEQKVSRNAKELETVKAALRKAKAEGDTDTELELTEKMNELQIERLVLQGEKSEIEEETSKQPAERKETTPSASQPEIPEITANWLRKNIWVTQDPTAARTLAVVSQRLIDSGMDYESESFYDVLTDKLNKALKAIDYDDYEAKPLKPKPKTQSEPQRKAPAVNKDVDSSSSMTRRAKDGKVYVKATADDVEMANRLGLDLKEYMKEKIAYEKSQKQRSDGTVWTALDV